MSENENKKFYILDIFLLLVVSIISGVITRFWPLGLVAFLVCLVVYFKKDDPKSLPHRENNDLPLSNYNDSSHRDNYDLPHSNYDDSSHRENNGLPLSNYDILGYITTAYLFFVTILGWDYKINYGYYEVLRWSVSIFAFWSAYRIRKEQNNIWFLIFLGVGILFNPIAEFELKKDAWQNIDLITFVLFCIYGFKHRNK